MLLPFLTAIAHRSQQKFIRKLRQTEAVQAGFLQTLLRSYQNTVLGQTYGLSEIQTIDQFRERVPVLPYSAYEPYIERIIQGEQNVLTADPVVYLNLTSGSTGPKKLIPVTRRFQNSLTAANLTSIGFLSEALRLRGQTFGKLLVTNSAKILGHTPGGIEYGQASAGVIRMSKFLSQQIFVQPSEALRVSDSRSRHYLCLLFALQNASMRGIAANFPMLVLRTADYLDQYAEELIHDLKTGKIAEWLTLEPALRKKLEQQWTAHPKRAAQLQEILHAEGRLTPHLAWSDLAFIVTARGGTSDFYFERFPDYFGDTPSFGAVYASAEGTFSIYPDLNQDGSILAIDTGFFEFIPQSQWQASHPKTLLAHEVIVGDCYRILMTNYSGFYRYDIGDIVEVVGFYEGAPLLVFRYRQGGILSSTTEKTTEFHITQVVQSLQQEFSLLLEDFCVVLSENDLPACYVINIELSRGYKLDDPLAFLLRFDQILQEVNIHYAINRQRDQLPAPRLRILAAGSFAILRQRQIEKGIPDSQLKFPHVSQDRTFLAGLPVEREIRLAEEKV